MNAVPEGHTLKRLRAGIIGCGVIAPVHARSYRRVCGTQLAWCCDLVPERARVLAREFSIPNTTTDHEELLADPTLDAVSICTDHASHADLVCAALRAGKHVLCEKPLGTTLNDLERMCAAHASVPHLVFSAVFQHRFDPVYRKVRECIASQVLGPLLNVSLRMTCQRTAEYYQNEPWRGTWKGEGGSALINQTIHFIDILDWILGGIEVCSARCANLTHQGVIETEDTAVALISCTGGALGTIEASTSSRVIDWEAHLSLRGSTGVIELMNAAPIRVLHDNSETQARLRTGLDAAAPIPTEAFSKSYYGEGHPSNIADFLAAIREHRQPFVSGESACRAVKMVLQMYSDSAVF